MEKARDDENLKPEAAKPETKQQIDPKPQPRELTPEELKAIAGGPAIFNDF